MLSVDRCRSALGPDCPLTDEEIANLRDQFAALAAVALDLVARGELCGAAGEGD